MVSRRVKAFVHLWLFLVLRIIKSVILAWIKLAVLFVYLSAVMMLVGGVVALFVISLR